MANPGTAPVEYHVDAFNYATDSENRMHNDDTAPKFGFRGGLVPGIGVYSYMTRAMLESLGRDWLVCGRADVRFLKPVYDGERIRVEAALDEDSAKVSLVNPEGVLCAVGSASLTDAPEASPISGYSTKPVPDYEMRPAATLDTLPVGADLGAFEVDLDTESMTVFTDSMRETWSELAIKSVPCHPAFYPSMANEILVKNVALGPWIHAGSAVQHFAIPKLGARLHVQGRVEESFEKKGHDMVVLDVIISESGAPVARVRHTAIIRPRVANAT